MMMMSTDCFRVLQSANWQGASQMMMMSTDCFRVLPSAKDGKERPK